MENQSFIFIFIFFKNSQIIFMLGPINIKAQLTKKGKAQWIGPIWRASQISHQPNYTTAAFWATTAVNILRGAPKTSHKSPRDRFDGAGFLLEFRGVQKFLKSEKLVEREGEFAAFQSWFILNPGMISSKSPSNCSDPIPKR